MVKKTFRSGPKGVPSPETRVTPDRFTFFPNGNGDPPILTVQTKDLIVTYSNLPSDLKNMYVCKSY